MSSAGLTINPETLTKLLQSLQLGNGASTSTSQPSYSITGSARPPVNANMNPIQSNYQGNSFVTPGFQQTNPTNIPGGMLPPQNGRVWQNLTQPQRDRLLAQYGPGTQTPYQPTPQPQVTMPAATITSPQPSPQGGGNNQPIDWASLIQSLFTDTSQQPKTGGTPQPVTVTPQVDLPPQTQTQTPSVPTAPASVTDQPSSPNDTGSATQDSKQGGDVTIPFDGMAGDPIPPPFQPTPDISQLGKMGGMFTGGPAITPYPSDLTGLVPNNPAPGNVTTVDDPSSAQIAGMFGSGAPQPVTVTPSQLGNGGLSGGPAVVANDFGSSSSDKTGSAGGMNANDIVNSLISLGGLAAPTGVGALAGLLKGGYEAVNNNGDTYQTKGGHGLGNTILQNIDPRNPSLGEKAGLALGGLFGSGPQQLPMSAANDPTAQIGNQSMGGSPLSGLLSGSGLTGMFGGYAPTGMGNNFGTGFYSGGMFPSMNQSFQQMGGMLDLGGLTNLQAMGMGGM